MTKGFRLKKTDFPLYQLSEYENLVVKHGKVIDVDKETEKAILSKWHLKIDDCDYQTGYIWIPKSLLEVIES